MKIIQVIDSLEAGGAERMAVNYANALYGKISFSGLVASRSEGDLKKQLKPEVDYLFLARKSTLDYAAILRLRDYCRANKIDFIHAHSTSYFIALMVKLLYPKVRIIWHDHNGMSEFVDAKKPLAIKLASNFFKGIIVVNRKLQNWAIRELHTANVIYIPNFINFETPTVSETILQGVAGKRILCLANLREQKNHFLLLEIAEQIKVAYPEWTFHLVGKDFNDDYSRQLKSYIDNKKLNDSVFIYGSRSDTASIIQQCDIAILTSRSEGLPVSLLEFGYHKKPVVVTAVGEIPDIVINGQNGFIFPFDAKEEMSKAVGMLINDSNLRMQMGNALYDTICTRHSEDAIIKVYLNWLKTLEND